MGRERRPPDPISSVKDTTGLKTEAINNGLQRLHKSWARGHLRGTLPRRDQKEWIRPEKFDGNASLDTFLAYFDNCIMYNGWGNEDSLAHLRASLTGAAAQVL